MSRPDALLTFDLGTSACKAAILSPVDGRVLAAAEAEYPTHHPHSDWAEQAPSDWWGALVTTCRSVLEQAGPVSVCAIGLSSQRESVVAVDERGEPLGSAIVWLDRRSIPQAKALGAAFGEQEVHRRTGMRCDATFTATKLRWLSETAPDLVRRARWFLQPNPYLIFRLTGAPALDPSLASRTLLWQGERGGWGADLLEWAGVTADQLPPVVPSGAIAGHLTPAAAVVLGLPAGIPVATGAGDRACEALGAAVAGGRAMLSLGTALNVSTATATWPAKPAAGVVYSVHALPGQWLAEQGISTGGTLLRWLRDLTGATGYEELSVAAQRSPPGARGLLLLPFFMGARATRWNPSARGVLAGLTLGHGRGEIARAVMEGLALEARACLALADPAGEVSELVLLGGGARSEVWSGILAATAGRPAVALASAETATLGAALLAAQAVGLVSDPAAEARRWNAVRLRISPEPMLVAFYERLFGAYNRLYESMAPLFDELEAIKREGEMWQ